MSEIELAEIVNRLEASGFSMPPDRFPDWFPDPIAVVLASKHGIARAPELPVHLL